MVTGDDVKRKDFRSRRLQIGHVAPSADGSRLNVASFASDCYLDAQKAFVLSLLVPACAG
jgi:hypothetical protein